MKRVVLSLCAVVCFSTVAFAQPRPVEKKQDAKPQTKVAAPQSFGAKYEGGMFGFGKSESGTLKFDDANGRLVFFGKENKELFSIPYKAMLIIYPQSRSVRSTTGTVISAIPLPGAGLAGLMRSKRRYLIISFQDPDVDVKGTVNFKLDNKDLLESVLQTLGDKADLTRRGDAFYRPKDDSK